MTRTAPLKVLIADKLHADAKRALSDYEIFDEPGLDTKTLVDAVRAHDPHVIIVRSTKVTQDVFEAAGSLALVVRAGAGYDNIDVDAASARGIFVANCPGKNSQAVAELALGLIIACDRRIPDQTRDLRAGEWRKKEFGKCQGLFGRTLGIVGLGRIGKEVAVRAQSFGMPVLAWSRSLTDTAADELGVERVESLRELAQRSEIVSVHLAASPETDGLLGDEFFAALRPGAIFINTARGSVVDATALLRAARDKQLWVGLDVWSRQPKADDREFADPLIALPNVIGTHHNGASTEQAQGAVADETVHIVRQFAETGAAPHCVNRADSSPAQSLLTVRHENQPGVLASVFNVIDAAHINVEEMENVIYQGARAACARIFLDAPLSDDAVRAINAEPHVLSASQLPIAPRR